MSTLTSTVGQADSMVINRRLGEYVLLRRLAIGGQSEVFLAMKHGPEGYTRPVVLKALPGERRDDERFVKMFYREAYISSRFHHPHVINIHDARIVGGEHCMMMDFIAGQTVADIAQRGYQRKSPPTLKQVAQIISDACAGLHYVHHFRDLDNQHFCVVHRDISPQNLMVTYHGVTLLFDFGISNIMGLDENGVGLAGGKFAYMSPEQALGKPAGPSSDIFSMGIILYELATGFRLFRRSNQPAVLKAITEEEIPLPRSLRPEIPPFLENVIMRALEREPLDRYQSAGDMREDLNKFLDMVSEQQDIRKGLGTYVAAMFKDERHQVALTLQEGAAIEDAEPFDIEDEVHGLAETTLELAMREKGSSDSDQRPVMREVLTPEPEQASTDPVPVEASQVELHELRRELNMLRIGIGLLILVIVAGMFAL